MSIRGMAIMRVIRQIGHNGGLTAEVPETTVIKLGREKPVSHPHVIGQREMGALRTNHLEAE